MGQGLMQPIHGKIVTLRGWRQSDLPVFAEWMQPNNEWHQWDGPYYPRPTSDEINTWVDTIRRRVQAQEDQTAPEPYSRVVIATRNTDTLIGSVSWTWISEETNWIELGIAIFDPAYWGRGYGYEALGLWGDYLFRMMPKIVRLDLRTWSGNTRMMRLAEKLGYTLEARFRKARLVKGVYYDGIGYGILREEWAQKYPNGFADSLR